MHFSATVFGFASACLLALVLTPLVRRLATSLHLRDQPGERHIHTVGRPHIGGLALVGALVLSLASLQWGFARLPVPLAALTVGLLSASILVAVVGLIDDIRGCRPVTKLLVQVAAIAVLQLQVDILGLSGTSSMGVVMMSIGALLSIGWMLGITNAMNLIDGLDGLASGIAVISGLGLVALGWILDQVMVSLVAATLVGAALGFLRSNLHPAKIFMGDTGSMFLGFVMASLGAVLFWSHPQPATLVGLLFIIWVPSLDTLYAVVRRSAVGRSIFSADQGHLHHRLLDAGFSHRYAGLALCGLSGLSAAAGVQVAVGSHPWTWAGAVLLATLPLAWVLSLRPVRTGHTMAPQRQSSGAVSQNRAA